MEKETKTECKKCQRKLLKYFYTNFYNKQNILIKSKNGSKYK